MDIRETLDPAGAVRSDVAIGPLRLEPGRERRLPWAFLAALALHFVLLLGLYRAAHFHLAGRTPPPVAAESPRPVRVVFYPPSPRRAEPPPETEVYSDQSTRAASLIPPPVPTLSRLPAAPGKLADPSAGAPVLTTRDLARESVSAPPRPPPENETATRPDAVRAVLERPTDLAEKVVSPSLAGNGALASEMGFGSGALEQAIRREGFGNDHGGVGDTGPLDFDSKDFDWGPYGRILYEIIDRNWKSVIPLAARIPGVTGKVRVRFRIGRNGKLAAIRAQVLSCGRTALDQAALASVQMSDPLPPLPAEFSHDDVGVTFGYYYNMPIDHD